MFGLKKKKKKRSAILTPDEFRQMINDGNYTRLDQCPDIVTGCRLIADLVSSMTIYLMSNTEKGDVRIQNALSRHIDITPNRYMTRKAWMDAIVMNLLLYGKGNSVVIPETENGILADMQPVPPGNVSFIPEKTGYYLLVNGKRMEPEDVLHFTLNQDHNYPWKGTGVTASIRDVVNNLGQAAETENSFLKSKWQPSLIISVDGLIDELGNMEGRKKILDDYVQTTGAGEPWLLPADTFDVKEVRPLTLSDLAIKDTMELNKKTVASLLGVPSFVLGVGEYSEEAWNNFINTKIRAIAQTIEQELTRKLLLSDKWYFRFNIRSLYDYDIAKICNMYRDMRAMGVATGNEVRNAVGMSPADGLDEFVMLENYIPTDRLGDQKKLKGNENE